MELFEGLGIDMYFEGEASWEKIKEIDISTILSMDEVTGMIRDCFR